MVRNLTVNTSTGCLCALVLASQGLGQCYEIVELVSLGGASEAMDINDVGWAVGVAEDSDGLGHAALWIDGTLTDLGTLGGDESQANSLNSRGQVVGWSRNSDGLERAFLWEDGVMIDLGTLGGSSSHASAINDSSQIAGYSRTAAGPDHAFIWQDGEMTDLGTLTGKGESFGWGISASGIVVGQSQIVDGTHAVLWDKGEIIDLGTLGGETSWGRGINSATQIVGRSQAENDGPFHAYVWEDGEMTALAGQGGFARDINDASQIVGHEGCAVLWEGGFITCLADFLPHNTEWQGLQVAFAINDTGQIAGKGTINGEVNGFVLTQVSECQCDFNCDGAVNASDLLILLGFWGPCFNCDNCVPDLDDDCTVGASDLLILLSNWG